MLHSSKPFEQSVLSSLMLARAHVGESLSAFEFFDSEAASILDRLPLNASKPGFTVIVEASGAGSVQDRMESFVGALGEDSFEGVVSQDLESMKRLWSFREHVPVKMAKLGPNLKFDLSLPQSEYYALVNLVREKYGNSKHVIKIVGYGHVGDGNLHLNIALHSACSEELKLEISEFVYEKERAVNGSISAEHGIGRDKLAYIGFSKSESAIRIMRELKHMFDPKGILNPGRTIP
jgi:FAD/FMN-containing dehydrogenase